MTVAAYKFALVCSEFTLIRSNAVGASCARGSVVMSGCDASRQREGAFSAGAAGIKRLVSGAAVEAGACRNYTKSTLCIVMATPKS
jgi:hypothetical protein